MSKKRSSSRDFEKEKKWKTKKIRERQTTATDLRNWPRWSRESKLRIPFFVPLQRFTIYINVKKKNLKAPGTFLSRTKSSSFSNNTLWQRLLENQPTTPSRGPEPPKNKVDRSVSFPFSQSVIFSPRLIRMITFWVETNSHAIANQRPAFLWPPRPKVL